MADRRRFAWLAFDLNDKCRRPDAHNFADIAMLYAQKRAFYLAAL